MPIHNSVPTTCTASQLTGWSISGLKSNDPKVQVNARLRTVDELMKAGFKRDFAIIFATTTQNQVTTNGLDEFLPRCGFELVFRGIKDDDKKTQRHQETGDISMWAVTPKKYEESLKAYHAELTKLKDEIDPPKKPDPERMKKPDLLLSALRKANLVHDNTAVLNPVRNVLLVDEETIYRHIKLKFGIDLRKWNNWGTDWVLQTIDSVKRAQKAWKEELV